MPDKSRRLVEQLGERDGWTRRTYLVATAGSAASIGALSGCSSGGDGEDGGGEDGGTQDGEDDHADGEDEHAELPEGVSEEEFENGPVPSVYQTGTSIGRETRNPDEMTAKADVQFSEFADAQENDAHIAGTCCANCADYIIDKNGDTFGACAEVQGYIDGEDWCTVYEELPEPEVPEGMSEDDLATAEVPEAYRTAASQGGEARTPDDLFSHEDVSLTESVEAIADGMANPGQSCGNCAEFIPDKNGDGWGACAKVEGYIAVEDWCTTWEHVSEEL
ncbi:MAG: high-potential iron-sulfur protein [Haloarculaceae archaeon]